MTLGYYMRNIQMTYASMIGTVHEKLNYNNQDAVLVHRDKDIIIGLLADGCGSGSHTEVGGHLMINYLKNYLLSNDLSLPHWKENLKDNLLTFLKNILLNQREEDTIEFIKNYLLVSFVGFVITPEKTTLFSCGNGVHLVNDSLTLLGKKKRVKYLVRELLIKESVVLDWSEIETRSLKRLVIATDGIEYLLDNALSLENIIEEFVHHQPFYKSSVALKKFLQNEQKAGILRDDTSIIMVINDQV